MKIEDLVLSVDQMNHLKELGLNVKDTALCWCRFKSDEDNIYSWDFCKGDVDRVDIMEYEPTLTLQEILEKLPIYIKEYSDVFKKEILYDLNYSLDNVKYEYVENNSFLEDKADYSYTLKEFEHGTFLNQAYEMLCWVIENGYLKE